MRNGWLPHFEKMLYDNALLSRLYLHTWQASGDELFKNVAVQIYDYLLREMTAPNAGFYSTTDADSEGHEGKFFVWTPAEMRAVLTPHEAEIAIAYWGVSSTGNFEGKIFFTRRMMATTGSPPRSSAWIPTSSFRFWSRRGKNCTRPVSSASTRPATRKS